MRLLIIILFLMVFQIHGTEGMQYQTNLTFLKHRPPLSVKWLKQLLSKEGFVENDFIIDNLIFYTKKLSLLKRVNFIRAIYPHTETLGFAHLILKDSAGEQVDCITSDPEQFKTNISYLDQTILVKSLKLPEIKSCQVNPHHKASYLKSGIDQIKQKYFDTNRRLKDDFSALEEDPNFINHLLNLGLFPVIGDETGQLTI